MGKLEVSARMTIRQGQLEGFKQQAAEIIRQTKENDTKTLRYDWFLNGDQTQCEVREAYESSEGLIEHRMHIGAKLSTNSSRNSPTVMRSRCTGTPHRSSWKPRAPTRTSISNGIRSCGDWSPEWARR